MALAACGSEATTITPDPAQKEPAGDPPRLVVEYLSAPGGASMPTRFFDTKLDTSCRPFEAADGKLRCLPWRDFEVESSVVVFASDACEDDDAVIGVTEECGSPRFLLLGLDNPPACIHGREVWQLGDVHQGDLWRKTGDICEPIDPDPEYVWRSASRVAPETLVELEVTR